MEKLLNRCVHEADGQVRLLLAVCLGEVGAIGEHRLGDLKLGSSMGDASLDSPNSSYRWRLEQPPWQSQAEKYELQLVTQHLAAAIKAAPSSADQHKVAFTIQQLLRLLDNNSATQDVAAGATDANQRGREMSEWLRNKLTDSGVYETIEPFWFSEFSEKGSLIYGRSQMGNSVIPNEQIALDRRLCVQEATVLRIFSFVLLLDSKLLSLDDTMR